MAIRVAQTFALPVNYGSSPLLACRSLACRQAAGSFFANVYRACRDDSYITAPDGVCCLTATRRQVNDGQSTRQVEARPSQASPLNQQRFRKAWSLSQRHALPVTTITVLYNFSPNTVVRHIYTRSASGTIGIIEKPLAINDSEGTSEQGR